MVSNRGASFHCGRVPRDLKPREYPFCSNGSTPFVQMGVPLLFKWEYPFCGSSALCMGLGGCPRTRIRHRGKGLSAMSTNPRLWQVRPAGFVYWRPDTLTPSKSVDDSGRFGSAREVKRSTLPTETKSAGLDVSGREKSRFVFRNAALHTSYKSSRRLRHPTRPLRIHKRRARGARQNRNRGGEGPSRTKTGRCRR